jgi:phage-related holin
MIYLFTFGFIVLDFVAGITKALMKKQFKSSIMRQGLFHKMGFLLCIVAGVLIDKGQMYIDLGFNVPVAKAICGYVVLTEIGSFIENVSIINPKLVPAKLRSIMLNSKEN